MHVCLIRHSQGEGYEKAIETLDLEKSSKWRREGEATFPYGGSVFSI